MKQARGILVFAFILVWMPSLTISQITHPQYWYRADKKTDTVAGVWSNYQNDSIAALFDSTGSLPDFSQVNFNPAFSCLGPFSGFYNILKNAPEVATVYMLYHTESDDKENFLWSLQLTDEKRVQLSTRRLRQFRSEIAYTDTGITGPILSASFISWKPVDDDSSEVVLRFAGSDTMTMLGKAAEFLFFPKKLNSLDNCIYQTYLAIKYGVSLVNSPYISSAGDTIWNCDDSKDYNTDIAGIGRDTVFELHQKQSKSYADIITLAAGKLMPGNFENPTNINQGDYLLWANNGKTLVSEEVAYLWDTTVNAILDRNWVIKTVGNAGSIATSIYVDASKLDTDRPENCILLLDTSGNGVFDKPGVLYVYPDSLSADSLICFSGLSWDPDQNGKDIFTLAIKSRDKKKSEELPEIIRPADAGSGEDGQTEHLTLSDQGNEYRLYPNPTGDQYHLEVSLSKVSDVRVDVFDNAGRLYDTYQSSGDQFYHFEKHLNVPGLYQIRVVSASQSQTLHLIVR